MFEGPPTGEDLSRFEESFLSRFDDFSEEELNSDASQLQSENEIQVLRVQEAQLQVYYDNEDSPGFFKSLLSLGRRTSSGDSASTCSLSLTIPSAATGSSDPPTTGLCVPTTLRIIASPVWVKPPDQKETRENPPHTVITTPRMEEGGGLSPPTGHRSGRRSLFSDRLDTYNPASAGRGGLLLSLPPLHNFFSFSLFCQIQGLMTSVLIRLCGFFHSSCPAQSLH